MLHTVKPVLVATAPGRTTALGQRWKFTPTLHTKEDGNFYNNTRSQHGGCKISTSNTPGQQAMSEARLIMCMCWPGSYVGWPKVSKSHQLSTVWQHSRLKHSIHHQHVGIECIILFVDGEKETMSPIMCSFAQIFGWERCDKIDRICAILTPILLFCAMNLAMTTCSSVKGSFTAHFPLLTL